jgi:hypothetical protein
MNGEAVPVNLVDLIDRLAEPPMPDPVSLAPQTAGWWVLGAVVLSGLAYGLWRLWLHWRANAYRRAALQELASAGDDPARVAAILRRTALAAYPRRAVAGLAGDDWLAFLRATGGFPESAGPALIRAPYAPVTEAKALRTGAERWIRTHRRAP